MVSGDGGQLYTIEGFAAALIMIITAFLVVNATSVYTAGDTHINDMQLEALGTDALKMMNTPLNNSENALSHNTLQTIIESDDSTVMFNTFSENFLTLVNENGTGPRHNIQFNASYTCRDISNNNAIVTIPFSYTRNLTGGEHAVRATKWVIVNNDNICSRSDDQAVLVEVLLWRD